MSRTLAHTFAFCSLLAILMPPVAKGEPPSSPAAVVGLSGEIDNFNRDSFFKRFNEAKAGGAKTIVVDIDTWGGLVTAALEISQFLRSQNDIHTIAYVDPKAISAGAMIAMACDEIVMRDVAQIGDCAPIVRSSSGGLEPLPTAERAKLQSPIATDFYESAVRNHHDPLLAEAMVVTEVAVYWVENPKTHARKFVNQTDYDKLTKESWTPVEGAPNPIDSATSLLTVGTELAIKIGLASGKASSVDQLAQQRHLNILMTLRSGFGEAAIAWFNSDWVRMLLMIVCGVSVYTAMHAPGHGTAEALVVTTLGLLLGVPLLAGYANWWEIVLILGGLAMIAFEIFVFPHAGIMILTGILMMIGGLVLTFVPSEPGGFRFVPKLSGTMIALRHGMAAVAGGLIGATLLSSWIGRYLPKLPYFRRLVLTTVNGEPMQAADEAAPITWPAIGSLGRAVTPLRPGGAAEFPNATGSDVKIFSVVSESGFLDEGSPVVVRDVGGGRVVVRSTVA